jgi:hypothetical protein
MNVNNELIFTDMKYKKAISLIFGDRKGFSYIHPRNTQAGIKQLRTEGYVLRNKFWTFLTHKQKGVHAVSSVSLWFVGLFRCFI